MSGLSSASTVPGGSFAKAALVGANTVNGPGPCKVSTRPAAFTAATSVVWSLELTAFWMMFFDGYIGAPPTVTVCSFICASVGVGATAPKASAAAVSNKAVREAFMWFSIRVSSRAPQRIANGDTDDAGYGCRRGSAIKDSSTCPRQSPDRWANRSANRRAARPTPRAARRGRGGRRARAGSRAGGAAPAGTTRGGGGGVPGRGYDT